MRAALALVSIVEVGAGCGAPTDETIAEIRVYENPDDSAITEGETVLAVDPDVAYRAVSDYAKWPAMFPAVHEVLITKTEGVDARVTFVHVDGNRDNLHFHNRPEARTLWFEDTGGRAEVWAETAFAPGDRPGTTRVHSRLYADVKGLASLVVKDDQVRAMRRARVANDLADVRK
jgi:hypothetical protein